ncbi:MerR family transcriptional regulator [Paenibacillus hamazuiensis]|uniref:MerR family transcriptional regulator n=1 Tax=Paenibacillus hamazuiensis TaxID=2936508 RepID=UPI00200C7083|nr:MerR family transcriptional regulator [Paenibacillus hamazuiensis]
MFKISAFAKISRVSVKTLRFYDELGLLKPAHVDEFTGYRYYSPEQLLTVKRISAFKEQGFTLEQIKPLLDDGVSPEQVKQLVAAKRAELERTIREAERRLGEMDARLARLERTVPSADQPEVKLQNVKPQLVASVRAVCPRSHLCLLLDEVKAYVRAHGEDDNAPLTVLWHDCGGEGEHSDVEVAVAISKEIPGSDRVSVKWLPELKAAVLVHRCDPYVSSCPAMDELASWMAANGCRPSDTEPVRETYLTPDKEIYGSSRTAELIVPVVPAVS